MLLLTTICAAQPALTSRGLREADFVKVRQCTVCAIPRSHLVCPPLRVQISSFLERAVGIATEVQRASGKMLKDFVAALRSNTDVEVSARRFCHSRAPY